MVLVCEMPEENKDKSLGERLMLKHSIASQSGGLQASKLGWLKDHMNFFESAEIVIDDKIVALGSALQPADTSIKRQAIIELHSALRVYLDTLNLFGVNLRHTYLTAGIELRPDAEVFSDSLIDLQQKASSVGVDLFVDMDATEYHWQASAEKLTALRGIVDEHEKLCSDAQPFLSTLSSLKDKAELQGGAEPRLMSYKSLWFKTRMRRNQLSPIWRELERFHVLYLDACPD